jgi:hypothetical protein
LRKKGRAIAKSKNASGQTVYRIENDGPVIQRAKDAA